MMLVKLWRRERIEFWLNETKMGSMMFIWLFPIPTLGYELKHWDLWQKHFFIKKNDSNQQSEVNTNDKCHEIELSFDLIGNFVLP